MYYCKFNKWQYLLIKAIIVVCFRQLVEHVMKYIQYYKLTYLEMKKIELLSIILFKKTFKKEKIIKKRSKTNSIHKFQEINIIH